MLGQRLKAESLYQRSITLDSLYMPAHFNLIALQLGLKRWPEAEASYARAIRQLPGMPWIRTLGVYLAEQKADYATAEFEPVRSIRSSAPTPTGAPSRAVSSQPSPRYVASCTMPSATCGRPWRHESRHPGRTIISERRSSLGSVIAVVKSDRARGFREVQRALDRYPLDSFRPMDRPYFDLAYVSGLTGRRTGRVSWWRSTSAWSIPSIWLGHRASWRVPGSHRSGRAALARCRRESLWQAQAGEFPDPMGWPELARAYDQLGKADSADRPVPAVCHQSQRARGAATDATELPRVYRRLGELYEQRGDAAMATEAYGRFVELWKNCDPELRPQVMEARRRLAELAKRG